MVLTVISTFFCPNWVIYSTAWGSSSKLKPRAYTLAITYRVSYSANEPLHSKAKCYSMPYILTSNFWASPLWLRTCWPAIVRLYYRVDRSDWPWTVPNAKFGKNCMCDVHTHKSAALHFHDISEGTPNDNHMLVNCSCACYECATSIMLHFLWYDYR